MTEVQQPGRFIRRDLGRGETPETEIDRFIERHHERLGHDKEAEAREQEASWRASERRATAERIKKNHASWVEFWERGETIHLSLAARCREKAAQLRGKGVAS